MPKKNPAGPEGRQGSVWNSSPASSDQNNATPTRIVQENLAARRVANHYGLPFATASVVAELAYGAAR